MAKFAFEIETIGDDASDDGRFLAYGTICAEGDTLQELLECATIDRIDQDGGTYDYVDADAPWMQNLIRLRYIGDAMTKRYVKDQGSSTYWAGTYPSEATKEELETFLAGSWGGRYEKFDGGEYIYVSYAE